MSPIGVTETNTRVAHEAGDLPTRARVAQGHGLGQAIFVDERTHRARQPPPPHQGQVARDLSPKRLKCRQQADRILVCIDLHDGQQSRPRGRLSMTPAPKTLHVDAVRERGPTIAEKAADPRLQ